MPIYVEFSTKSTEYRSKVKALRTVKTNAWGKTDLANCQRVVVFPSSAGCENIIRIEIFSQTRLYNQNTLVRNSLHLVNCAKKCYSVYIFVSFIYIYNSKQCAMIKKDIMGILWWISVISLSVCVFVPIFGCKTVLFVTIVIFHLLWLTFHSSTGFAIFHSDIVRACVCLVMNF